jgi:PKD repeat protein
VSRTFSLEEAQQQEPSVSVNFTDQTVPNGTEQVTVDSAEFTQADGSAGDYVVVVHTIDEFGAPVGEVSKPIGASGDLTGAEEDITVDLTAADGPIDSITEDVTLRAMLHTTDNNSAFGTRLGSEDAAIDGIEPGDETDDANITISEDIFVEPAPGVRNSEGPPQDSDGDGISEDVNGDGQFNFKDVIALAFTKEDRLTDQQRDAFDVDEDGDFDFDDVVELAFDPDRN